MRLIAAVLAVVIPVAHLGLVHAGMVSHALELGDEASLVVVLGEIGKILEDPRIIRIDGIGTVIQ